MTCGARYQHLVGDGRAEGDGNGLFIGVKKWASNMHLSKRRKRYGGHLQGISFSKQGLDSLH